MLHGRRYATRSTAGRPRLIAVDTNILVYAHRRGHPWHDEARKLVTALAEGDQPWATTWHTLREFLAVVTSSRVWPDPTPVEAALRQADLWLESPSIVVLGEAPGYFAALREALMLSRVTGPAVHDANVAAVCQLHGVSELWSADRDFSRFPALSVRNPLVAAP